MRRNSEWFDRHPKTRIALQLLLDAMPFLLMIGFGVCIWNVFSYDLALEWLMHVVVFGFLIGAIPLFVLGIVLRGRADGEFACYAWCEKLSIVLRITGALAISIALVIDAFAIAMMISH